MKNISWLHFSDLHIGCPKNEGSWSFIKADLYRDIEQVYDLSGKIDFVLFSGDVTFSGQTDQFKAASDFLYELWDKFDKLGSTPLFFCVPGNHDLVRQDRPSAAARMLKMWEDQPDVQKELWDEASEYYQFIKSSFANYQSWYDNIKLPKPELFKKGYLPGDFSSSFTANGIQIGIAGLNSSFLHFADLKQTDGTALSKKQLSYVTDSNPHGWCDKNTISMLTTHHGPDWYTQSSKEEYRSEIYVPSLFYAHFYGHMHDPADISFSEGGSEERRMRQGVSLFGLEDTASGKRRVHGYSFYNLNIDKDSMVERVKPRNALKLHDGRYKLTPNHEYDLDEENTLTRIFNFNKAEEQKSTSDPEPDTYDTIVDTPITDEFSKETLDKIGNDTPSFDVRHAKIRISELKKASQLLKQTNFLWIKCDWGMGKEGFLGALLKNEIQKKQRAVYRIDLDEVLAIDEVHNSSKERLGLNLEEFIANLPPESPVTFILDNISTELISNYGEELFKKIDILKDVHSNSQYICASRYTSPVFIRDSVEIFPLNIYDVKEYISSNPNITQEMLTEEYLDAISDKSGNIPILIDNIIRKLRVVSLNEIYSDEHEFDGLTADTGEPIPKSLKYAISKLENSSDSVSQRCYKLLKVLSFLPSGESLKTIRYTFQRAPFYPDYAVKLQDLALINTTSSPISLKLQAGSWLAVITTQEKILKVSRHIREYVILKMSNKEKEDIVKKITNILFGSDWRQGKLKMAKNKILSGRGVTSTGPGNEHSLIKHVLRKATDNNDKRDIDSALRIASTYCSKICNSNRYRDAVLATKEILTMVEGFENQYIGSLCVTHGKALRMLSRRQSAIEYLEYSIKINLIKDKDDLVSAHLNIAYAYDTEGDTDNAVIASNKVKELSSKGDSSYNQAESIIAEMNDKKNDLVDIEKKSRNKGQIITANNVALTLAAEEDNIDKKIQYYDCVIDSKGDTYNTIRAAAQKVKHMTKNNCLEKIDNRDKQIVRFGYSLQFSQRTTGLFNTCHNALWEILKYENKIKELLRVYRLSSLIWRLSEKRTNEEECLNDLIAIVGSTGFKAMATSMDYQYFTIRSKALIQSD
ncbi:Calcineurin-like phosphoesterase [Maridesulfovibrio ferrireducens]|uniref:Calcineurin-like phosphoesterase n=1 Tax=Maridesulfovibrio ferrireducens TaxID=246191 RepID=A0A1G9L3T6_9BACT|nr:metallophosphoesterase [Maridesulfovibrio ferrireducens]SDL56659.1 Calcineurin-like phosphoesterase [Maridesulfovibrio ferrireducens]